MGANIIEKTVSAEYEPTLITIPLFKGELTSIICFPTNSALGGTQAFGEIGLLTSTEDYFNRTAILGSGYLGSQNTLFWEGLQPIGADDFVFAQISALLALTYRLVIRTTPSSLFEEQNGR